MSIPSQGRLSTHAPDASCDSTQYQMLRLARKSVGNGENTFSQSDSKTIHQDEFCSVQNHSYSAVFMDLKFEETVSVRYYVRCIFVDSTGRRFWNTVEVVMARLRGVLPGDYLVGDIATPDDKIRKEYSGEESRAYNTRFAEHIV